MIEKIKHHRSHPWHQLSIGKQAPDIITCYIEMVPTDTVKYELDKETGLLKVDRPQKYSSLCPSLYGFIPETYAGNLTAEYCMQKSGLTNIRGDKDPVDICVLTEKMIPRGDIILQAVPIGGFRMIDNNEADDKLIAVLVGDFVYGNFKDIRECPKELIERLKHYFLTYKSNPESENSNVKIPQVYDSREAKEVIECGRKDYKQLFGCSGRSS